MTRLTTKWSGRWNNANSGSLNAFKNPHAKATNPVRFVISQGTIAPRPIARALWSVRGLVDRHRLVGCTVA